MKNTQTKPPISFEFFPPKTPEGWNKLKNVQNQLYKYKPEFCSVTFGAGGSTQSGTLEAVSSIIKDGVDAAPHLSCIGQSRQDIEDRLNEYKKAGVKKIVALRGDLPSGYGIGGEFKYASDLVKFIREKTNDYFQIEVAAYPETHPQAKSPAHDIKALKTKQDAGANSAITQYFFNQDAYFKYIEECQKEGITIPIIAGIMPIINSTQLLRFSDNCGAEVPRWIRNRLISFGDDTKSIKQFGQEVVTNLCEQLIKGGAVGFHFYTMNQYEPISLIYNGVFGEDN